MPSALIFFFNYTATTEIYTLSLHDFFFNDTATTEIYTLSLHDALPISSEISESVNFCVMEAIKLCRLDTPIIFIEARINLSRFVVTGCAAKTSATVTFPSLNLISLDRKAVQQECRDRSRMPSSA